MPTRNVVHTLTICLLLLVINAPNFALTIYSSSVSSALTTIFLPSLLLALAIYAIAPQLTLYAFCPLMPLALLEMLYIMRYERATDEHVIAIIQETDFNEAVSWLGVSGLAILAAALLAMGLGLMIVLRSKSRPHLPKRWRVTLAVAGVLAFGLIHAHELMEFEFQTIEKNLRTSPVQAHANEKLGAQLTGDLTHSSLNDHFPWGLPLRIQRYLGLQEGMKSARNELSKFRFGAFQATGRINDEEIFLLVIGETGRPDRWQINGYDRPTNPRLNKQDGLISFTNATTGWAWTRMSVPVIVSRKPSQISTSFFPERSVISAFNEAGFWTAWYSMHGALGFHESPVALYANEANDVRFINPTGYRSPGAYDLALLKPLDEALERTEKKKFIVLHTMGSHFNYAHRVPPEFEIFRPSIRDQRGVDLHDRSQREQLNNSYDNSIRYTDHFLAEVIQRLAATDKVASLLYVADHGENIFDGECEKSGHGHNTEHDYRIAALWWNSAAFAERYPGKVTAIAARKDAPWMTENVFATLLDAGGIDIPGQPGDTRSLLSHAFTPQPRWIQSGGHFDTATRDGVCGFLMAARKTQKK